MLLGIEQCFFIVAILHAGSVYIQCYTNANPYIDEVVPKNKESPVTSRKVEDEVPHKRSPCKGERFGNYYCTNHYVTDKHPGT